MTLAFWDGGRIIQGEGRELFAAPNLNAYQRMMFLEILMCSFPPPHVPNCDLGSGFPLAFLPVLSSVFWLVPGLRVGPRRHKPNPFHACTFVTLGVVFLFGAMYY